MTYDWGRSSYSDWTTQDEINMVRSIADRTNPYSNRYHWLSYQDSLRAYLKTMDLRSNWASINPMKVRAWVMAELGATAQKER